MSKFGQSQGDLQERNIFLRNILYAKGYFINPVNPGHKRIADNDCLAAHQNLFQFDGVNLFGPGLADYAGGGEKYVGRLAARRLRGELRGERRRLAPAPS